MKLAIDSQWQEHYYIQARTRQLIKAAHLAGAKSVRVYAGVPAALSEDKAVRDWLESYESRRMQHIA